MEENSETNDLINNKISEDINKSNSQEINESESKIVINIDKNNTKPKNISTPKVDIKNGNDAPAKTIPKPEKELPIEKKPFQEFINYHLIPSFKREINQRGLEINKIDLKNTNRPIAGDKCWL